MRYAGLVTSAREEHPDSLPSAYSHTLLCRWHPNFCCIPCCSYKDRHPACPSQCTAPLSIQFCQPYIHKPRLMSLCAPFSLPLVPSPSLVSFIFKTSLKSVPCFSSSVLPPLLSIYPTFFWISTVSLHLAYMHSLGPLIGLFSMLKVEWWSPYRLRLPVGWR